MQFLKELWRRTCWLAGRSRFDSRVADEIQARIESRAEELEQSGVHATRNPQCWPAEVG